MLIRHRAIPEQIPCREATGLATVADPGER